MTTEKKMPRKHVLKAKTYEEEKHKYFINIRIKSLQMPNTGIGNNMGQTLLRSRLFFWKGRVENYQMVL